MTLAAEERVDQLLRERLSERGVVEQVDEIDLFPTPEGVLAEVVLRDASALERARQAVDKVRSQLERERISLLPTVRALWEVEDVQRIEILSPPGAPSDLVGALFKGTLRSGARHQEVWVAVTPWAQQVLRPLATNDQALLELVRAFLRHRLSIGGAGYWDPIREQRLELNEGAARYLRWRPYEALRSSIDDTFSPSVGSRKERVTSFVKSMNFSHGQRKIRDFQAALTDLPQPSSAYARGERLVTNNYEMFGMALESERRELEKYYLEQVDKAEQDFPDLKRKFPAVFK